MAAFTDGPEFGRLIDDAQPEATTVEVQPSEAEVFAVRLVQMANIIRNFALEHVRRAMHCISPTTTSKIAAQPAHHWRDAQGRQVHLSRVRQDAVEALAFHLKPCLHRTQALKAAALAPRGTTTLMHVLSEHAVTVSALCSDAISSIAHHISVMKPNYHVYTIT